MLFWTTTALSMVTYLRLSYLEAFDQGHIDCNIADRMTTWVCSSFEWSGKDARMFKMSADAMTHKATLPRLGLAFPGNAPLGGFRSPYLVASVPENAGKRHIAHHFKLQYLSQGYWKFPSEIQIEVGKALD